jgi:hypothetical protein
MALVVEDRSSDLTGLGWEVGLFLFILIAEILATRR